MRLLRDVWRGERSLRETFWLWTVTVGGIVINVGGGLLAGMLTAKLDSALPLYLFVAIALCATAWILVGLWRAANREPGVWGTIAKVLAVACIAAAGVHLFERLAAP